MANGTTRGAPAQQQATAVTSSSNTAKIDLDHLRPTTKFDQLTDALQREIEAVDNQILQQVNLAHEVADALPAIISAGQNLPNDVDYVAQKLDEVEAGLENDAGDIVTLRDSVMRRDEGEAKLCFRMVDKLKVPVQYQTQHTSAAASGGVGGGGIYGGSGLSGWWNHPQTLQRSMRAMNGVGSKSLQLPDDDVDESMKDAPATLVDLCSRRADDMRTKLQSNKDLLSEIEAFVDGLEGKIMAKQHDLEQRSAYGRSRGGGAPEDDKEYQIQLLKYVFGEVERSLYDVADKVGSCRDATMELGMKRA